MPDVIFSRAHGVTDSHAYLDRLAKRPNTFRSFTGLQTSEFDSLYGKVESGYEKSEEERLSSREGRERRVGWGGRRFKLPLEKRLLMLLVYYKLYITFTLAGYSYIESLYPWGEMGKVLASYQTVPLPFLELNTTAIAFDQSSLPSSSALWSNWNFLLEELGNPASGNVLLFSERAVIPTASLLGIPPTDPKWKALMNNFTRFDQVYDNNGFLVLT